MRVALNTSFNAIFILRVLDWQERREKSGDFFFRHLTFVSMVTIINHGHGLGKKHKITYFTLCYNKSDVPAC